MDDSRICHCLLLRHERGKQYFVQPFLRSVKLLRLHVTLKLWAEFVALMHGCRLCMDLPEANSTTVRDLYCLWPDCLCHACVIFVPRASRRRCTLAVAFTDATAGWAYRVLARNYPRTFGLHEIFKCAHLKFTVYGRKQTYTQLPQMQLR